MEIQERIHKYIHDYIYVFLSALREHSVILSMASVKEIDGFYDRVKDLENKGEYTNEDYKTIIKLSEYFGSVSTEFVIDLLEQNDEIFPEILKFMYQSNEINLILKRRERNENS